MVYTSGGALRQLRKLYKYVVHEPYGVLRLVFSFTTDVGATYSLPMTRRPAFLLSLTLNYDKRKKHTLRIRRCINLP